MGLNKNDKTQMEYCITNDNEQKQHNPKQIEITVVLLILNNNNTCHRSENSQKCKSNQLTWKTNKNR